MREALLLAQEAAADGEVPVGCVITLEDRIVGRGRNRREKGKTALAHAELEAIGEACRTLGGWRLWQCTLYVTLEPCPMCAGASSSARVIQNPARREVLSICCICQAVFSRRSAAAYWKRNVHRRCAIFSAHCAKVTADVLNHRLPHARP